jgi:hypothetical protein
MFAQEPAASRRATLLPLVLALGSAPSKDRERRDSIEGDARLARRTSKVSAYWGERYAGTRRTRRPRQLRGGPSPQRTQRTGRRHPAEGGAERSEDCEVMAMRQGGRDGQPRPRPDHPVGADAGSAGLALDVGRGGHPRSERPESRGAEDYLQARDYAPNSHDPARSRHVYLSPETAEARRPSVRLRRCRRRQPIGRISLVVGLQGASTRPRRSPPPSCRRSRRRPTSPISGRCRTAKQLAETQDRRGEKARQSLELSRRRSCDRRERRPILVVGSGVLPTIMFFNIGDDRQDGAAGAPPTS